MQNKQRRKTLVKVGLIGIAGYIAFALIPPGLHRAAGRGDVPMTWILIHAGYDLNARKAENWKSSLYLTPVEWAARSGSTSTALLLLNAGANPVASWSVLGIAAYEHHQDMVAALLKAGVDADLPDPHGSALHNVLSGARKQWRKDSEGATSYQGCGAEEKTDAIVRILLDAGADPNARGPLNDEQIRRALVPGPTPLYSALDAGCLRIARRLVRSGADPHATVYGQSLRSLFAKNAGSTYSTADLDRLWAYLITGS